LKALIVYDSVYGNTEKIARAIAEALASAMEVEVVKPGEVDAAKLGVADLLVLGSPTQGGRPTRAIQDFIVKIPADGLKNIDVVTFDTAMPGKSFGMRTLVKIMGYAAPRIAISLKTKGGRLTVAPASFWVDDKDGPLSEGEPERAKAWAKELSEGLKPNDNGK
jgi:flavodoxin I